MYQSETTVLEYHCLPANGAAAAADSSPVVGNDILTGSLNFREIQTPSIGSNFNFNFRQFRAERQSNTKRGGKLQLQLRATSSERQSNTSVMDDSNFNFGQLRRKGSQTPSVVENSNFNSNFGQLRRKGSQTPSVVENSNFNFNFGGKAVKHQRGGKLQLQLQLRETSAERQSNVVENSNCNFKFGQCTNTAQWLTSTSEKTSIYPGKGE